MGRKLYSLYCLVVLFLNRLVWKEKKRGIKNIKTMYSHDAYDYILAGVWD